MNIEDLETEITTLAAHINAATARWLGLLAEFDRRCGYKRWECRSTAQWLSWRCGVDGGAAREKVRTALALEKLPVIGAAFSDGRLSYSKVRALTRVAKPESEAELCELAMTATASQLERIVGAIHHTNTIENPKEVERCCHWYRDDDGSVVFRAKLSAEEATVVIAALEKSGDAVRESVSAETSQPHSVNQADALVAMAESALANETQSCDERYQVVLHVDADVLAKDNGVVTTESGFALTSETARRLSCDASVVTQIEHDGEALSVGRKTRAIPHDLRRALRNRDNTCRFPGCDAKRFIDRHHIKHWAHGGETKLSNLVTLCRRHHRLCHEQRIHIAHEGESFTFLTRDGQQLHKMFCSRGNPKAILDTNLDVSAETFESMSGTGEKLTSYALDTIVGYFAQ